MSGLQEKVYFACPPGVQQAMVSLYGWWWFRRRLNPNFYRFLAEYEARDIFTYAQFKELQAEQLKRLLITAKRSPYYQNIFRAANVDWNAPAFDILTGLPFLSKETLRISPKELLTQAPLPKGTLVFKSSGTTGTPTEIYYTPEFHALELAVPAARNFAWAGIPYNSRRVMFGVRKVCRFDQKKPPFWRFSPAEDMAYASIYHLSPKNIPAYIDFLNRFRPAVIMGYPSALHVLAQFVLDLNCQLTPARGVFTTSETVTNQQRETIERAWQCKIYDRYGAVEGCMFASQCEYGSYHVSPEVGIIEILNAKGNACSAGQLGQVICTGLNNTLQPLIRYQTGDVARWSKDQHCACGREMPILEAIEGRVEDLCITPDGRQILRFDTVFKGVENIKEAQVIQEAIDTFTIRLVPTENFDEEDRQSLIHNMALHVGKAYVNISLVDLIERTAAGKFRAVICKLNPEEKQLLLRNSGQS